MRKIPYTPPTEEDARLDREEAEQAKASNRENLKAATEALTVAKAELEKAIQHLESVTQNCHDESEAQAMLIAVGDVADTLRTVRAYSNWHLERPTLHELHKAS